MCVCVCVCLFGKSCLTLCSPMDCSSPGSSVHGISQENGKLPLPSTRNLPHPESEIEPVSPALTGRFLLVSHLLLLLLLSLESCPTVRPRRGQPTRLPHPWDSPGKNNGVGCHSLLQGIFPTQGSNPGLLHCRQIIYHVSHQGSLPNSLNTRAIVVDS